VRGGIPFDVAFGLDDVTRAAWCIVFSQFEGSKFNWQTMQWDDGQ
jgi:hypothetical protein